MQDAVDSMASAPSLVPGRECGACTACCEWLLVDTPQFQKRPASLCGHAGARGCRIYAERYPICRSWYCAWRRYDTFPEAWRPDLSGILALRRDADIPAAYDKRPGLYLLIFWPLDMVLTPAFAQWLFERLAERIPLFIAVPGPPGCDASVVFANEVLYAANPIKDSDSVAARLALLVETLEASGFEPAHFRNGEMGLG